MTVQKIQLRGISRNPSDRTTAEGAVAESINVRLDNTEVVPLLKPTDLSRLEGFPAESEDYHVVYIHKQSAYTNYIATNNASNELKAYTEDDMRGVSLGVFEDSDTLKHISSIGNTLVAITNRGVYYYLFKDRAYKILGKDIPNVGVRFEAFDCEPQSREFPSPIGLHGTLAASLYDEWRVLFEGRSTMEGYNDLIAKCEDRIWEKYTNLRNYMFDRKRYISPVFIRYAIRLYDGDSYLFPGPPVLISGSLDTNKTLRVSSWRVENTDRFAIETLSFGIGVTLSQGSYTEDWKDIIKGVDIFMSTSLYNPQPNSKVEDVTKEDSEGDFVQFVFKGQSADSVTDLESEIRSKGNYYKVASFDMDELPSGRQQIDPISQDELVLEERLDDSAGSREVAPIGETFTYNNRLILCGVKTTFPNPQTGAFDGGLVGTSSEEQKLYKIAYHIRDEFGSSHTVVSATEGPYAETAPRGFISYPDPNCYQADVYLSDDGRTWTKKVILPMEEHPASNSSYGFFGLDTYLTENSRGRVVVTGEFIIPDNAREVEYRNKLFMSEGSNPFIFPVTSRLTFTTEVIGAASTTIALSEGQVGQHNLYVFTKDGIHAVGIAADGKFHDNQALPSRDIAIPGTITPIDQAIVFNTERGVMMLQGSAVSELSPYMNGPHYSIEPEARNLIDEFASFRVKNLLPAIGTSEPFGTAMASAKSIYDYVGGLLYFYGTSGEMAERGYMYIHDLKSGSWHRMYLGENVKVVCALNLYPLCVMTVKENGRYKMIQFSTVLDVSDNNQESMAGIVATRPLSFGMDDTYKTITKLELRGRFKRGNVKYVLLGSNDGYTWVTLNSLRGQSWKQYRVVILSELAPDERLSYIEVDVQPKFTDKIR